MRDPDVAVIGGGIAGTSVASHLATETDNSVSVFERGDVGGETTAKSAAFFGTYGTALERRMKRYGMRVYNGLFRESDVDLGYEHVGRVRVATSPEGEESLRRHAMGEDGVRVLDPDRIEETVLVPHLDPTEIRIATYRPHVGFLRSRELARGFAERARKTRDTVRIETDTTVEDIAVEDGSATGVVIESDHLTSEQVVCAAGPWNPQLTREAGIDVPMSHSLAPILRVDVGDPGYTLPVVSHHESGVYARGGESGTVLLGRYPPDPAPGRRDPDDVPDDVPEDLREPILDVTGRLLPDVADAPVVDEWVGVRSHTPDGHPIAGETSVEGLFLAGFDSSGIQLGPAVGRTIARTIAGHDAEFADATSPRRF